MRSLMTRIRRTFGFDPGSSPSTEQDLRADVQRRLADQGIRLKRIDAEIDAQRAASRTRPPHRRATDV